MLNDPLPKDPTFGGVLPFPKSVMYQIATYYVLLHNASSPRNDAKKSMNEILGNKLAIDFHPSLLLQNVQPILAKSEVYEKFETKEILVPVISNLSRSQSRPTNPLHAWMSLHLGTMHASQSTLQPMIKQGLLSDLPPSLKKVDLTKCSCHICNLRKATKLPRGKLVDKTKLAPFQHIHIDFSFFGYKSI